MRIRIPGEPEMQNQAEIIKHSKLCDAIKENIDLADYVRSCGITLSKHGNNDLKGLCPFHDDKNPSLIITPEKQLYHCPACGAGGSVIDFAMKFHKIDLKEAVKQLSGKIGSAEKKKKSVDSVKKELSPGRANQLLERVMSMYEKTFSDVPEGRKYLENRGITDAGLFSLHRVGYCNGTLTDILPGGGKIREELTQSGILLENGTERFTGCVVFPVFDSEGNAVTLYGRYTGKGQKRHVFLPGRPTGIWNAGALKTYPEIILVESVIDALSCEMAGFRNTVSVQGTNGLGDDDLTNFAECGVNSLILFLDGDETGRKAGSHLLRRLSDGFRVRNSHCPDGMDPNDYLLREGAEKLSFLLAASPETSGEKKPAENADEAKTTPDGFVFSCGIRNYEVRGLEKGLRKLKATIRLEHGGKLHVDTFDLYSARARRLFCQDVARIFDQAAETIENDMTRLVMECEKHEPGKSSGQRLETGPKEPEMTASERREAEAFGVSDRIFENILVDYEKCGLVGEESNKLLCYLAAVSRKMPEPLSVLVLSSSGAGKTALQDASLEFCPPEDVVKLTSLSGKALFYKESMSLKHKILALEEGAGAEDATYAIRNLISAGYLVIESTIKDIATGRLTTMENRVDGPTSVFQTTTDPEVDPETRSRFFVLSVDESHEQTKAILEFQRKRRTLYGLRDNIHEKNRLRTHHNFQRLLKPLAVVNPHADKLSFTANHLQSRRNQPKYLNLINAVAFLRQMRKEKKSCEIRGGLVKYIEVDYEDIELANRLADEVLGSSLDDMSHPGRTLLEQLEKLVETKVFALRKIDGDNAPATEKVTFGRKDIREFCGWANSRVHRYLKELIDLEYVMIESGRNGSPYRYRLDYDGRGKDGKKFMLGLKNVDSLKGA